MVTRMIALALAMLPVAAQAQTQAPAITVMSFNIRLPVAADGVNAWESRRDVAAAMVRRVAPDIIGTQELHWEQGDYLVEHDKRYGWVGVDRRGGRGDEYMGLFYRRDRLKLIRYGNFWLSDTPEVPGSISWGHPYPRMATWACFETKAGKRFYVFNTHFPYRAEDEAARVKAAAVLSSKMSTIAWRDPVILTGDFNTTPDSKVHSDLTTLYRDAWETSPVRVGPEKTFHGFTGKPDRRIDWILTRGFTVDRIETRTDHVGARWASDHFPVVATVRLAE